ncbi:polyketide antibiotic transporter [Microbacterium sp. SSW1-59]|uniref:ABC transporter permease n=1 Tax=Microbacterium xanthum TaxID=3079794 RepID=UPI002AD243FA|nr:polyketide antibiotic transporter [Microbacterium sp. SSW1-59]MDZ8200993.1 polyketide antibiotic transporter [Microbacterium sp. SSW1-59]
MTILLGQRLRRDARQLVLWIVGTALLAAMGNIAVADAFGTEQARVGLLAAAIGNPVILLFRGLPSGADQDQVVIFLILPVLMFLAALMNTFLAVRHTRAEEEQGRAELVSATPASRTTPLMATIAHGLLADVVLAVLVSLAFIASGLGAGGSFLAGSAVGGVGVSFLGVGLVAGQIMRTSRGANALAVWTVTALFLICGFGNALGTPSDDLQRMESSWLTWLSPFGWAENTRAFDDDVWWLLLPLIGLGAVLAGAALALQSVRDLGEGFVASRRGREGAGRMLASPTGLVWRLTRGGILGWAVGGLLVGILATSLSGVIDEFTQDNQAMRDMIAQMTGGADTASATVAVFFAMLGVLAACCAVQIACHARQEEAHGTAEPVLSTPIARVRWLADYVAVAAIGIVLVVGAAVAGAAIGIAADGGDADLLGEATVMGAGQAAAAAVFLASTALVFVVAPRLTIPLAWTLVMLGLVFGLFGPLFGFPDWLVDLSPIAQAPTVSGGEVELRGLWWLLAVTAAGLGAALALMRRRELVATS